MDLPVTALPAVGVALALLLASACGGSRLPAPPAEVEPVPRLPIAQVLRQHADSLMAVSGVVGVGEGLCDGSPCIKVFLAQSTPEAERIPRSLGGYPVAVEVTGRFRAPPP